MEFANEVAKLGKTKYSHLQFALLVRASDEYSHLYFGDENLRDFVWDFVQNLKSSTEFKVRNEEDTVPTSGDLCVQVEESSEHNSSIIVKKNKVKQNSFSDHACSAENTPETLNELASPAIETLTETGDNEPAAKELKHKCKSCGDPCAVVLKLVKRKGKQGTAFRKVCLCAKCDAKKKQKKEVFTVKGKHQVHERQTGGSVSKLQYFSIEKRPKCNVCGRLSTNRRFVGPSTVYPALTYYRWVCPSNKCKTVFLGSSNEKDNNAWRQMGMGVRGRPRVHKGYTVETKMDMQSAILSTVQAAHSLPAAHIDNSHLDDQVTEPGLHVTPLASLSQEPLPNLVSANSGLKYFSIDQRPNCGVCGALSLNRAIITSKSSHYRWICPNQKCKFKYNFLGLSNKEDHKMWKQMRIRAPYGTYCKSAVLTKRELEAKTVDASDDVTIRHTDMEFGGSDAVDCHDLSKLGECIESGLFQNPSAIVTIPYQLINQGLGMYAEYMPSTSLWDDNFMGNDLEKIQSQLKTEEPEMDLPMEECGAAYLEEQNSNNGDPASTSFACPVEETQANSSDEVVDGCLQNLIDFEQEVDLL